MDGRVKPGHDDSNLPLHPDYDPMRGDYRAGSFANDGLPSGRWWKVCLSQV